MMTFQPWLDHWDLTADGAPFETLTSTLMPVRRNGDAGMLKLTTSEVVWAGGALLVWGAGVGAAAVWAREGEALLMARATGSGSLASMARDGRDDEACRVLCTAAARLHTKRPNPPPNTLVPLTRWFEALWPTAQTHGGLFAQSAKAARDLLDNPQDPTVLHGDLHHDNVLDFADRGWLAIDPKGLIGDRGYDHANMLCNPDAAVALTPGVLTRRLEVASAASGIAQHRLAKWLLAYAGLSASWTIIDPRFGDVADTLKIAALAAAALD